MTPKRTILTLISLLILFCISTAAVAEESFPVIATAELKKLIDEQGDKITLVDARNPEEYQEVHIKGAINIPERVLAEQAGKLPQDKASPIVFYCNGVKCGKSKKSAQKARELGYSNITVYAEGMPVWEEQGMPVYTGPDYELKIETTKIAPKELQALMAASPAEVTVVDVRDAAEFAEGHIPGAINIPVATFASQAGDLDKKKSIVVTCNSGGRSYNAYRKLMKMGYEKINQAILQDWKDAGLPIESGAR